MRACTKCGEMKPIEAFPPVRRGEAKLQTWCRDCFADANARNYQANREREKSRLLRQVNERRSEVRQKIIEYLQEHPCVDCGERDIVVLEFDHVRDKVADVSDYAGGGRSWPRVKAEIDKCEVRCANCHRRKTRATSFRPQVTVESEPVVTRATRAQLTLDAALGLRKCRVCKEVKPLTEFPFRAVARQTRQWLCLACQRAYTKDWYGRNRQKQIASARVRRDREAKNLGRKIRDYLRDHPCVDCGQSEPEVLDFDHLRDKRANVSRLVHDAVSWDLIVKEIAKCEVRCANCHRRRTARAGGYYRAIEGRMEELAR
jgi:hypothetical protein